LLLFVSHARLHSDMSVFDWQIIAKLNPKGWIELKFTF